jgi:hypothetical protein
MGKEPADKLGKGESRIQNSDESSRMSTLYNISDPN